MYLLEASKALLFILKVSLVLSHSFVFHLMSSMGSYKVLEDSQGEDCALRQV